MGLGNIFPLVLSGNFGNVGHFALVSVLMLIHDCPTMVGRWLGWVKAAGYLRHIRLEE